MPFPYRGTVPLSNQDLVSFTFDHPTFDKDLPIYVDAENPDNHYTWSTARQTVRQLIAGLLAAGLQSQDTVLIHSFNSPLYPLLMHAIIGAGGRGVCTNPAYTRSELAHALRLAKVKYVLAEPEVVDDLLEALKENRTDARKMFILDTYPGQQVSQGCQSYKRLLEHGETDWIRFDDEDRQRDTTAQLYYTSGTTGLPKCAEITHRNLVAQHQVYWEQHSREWRTKIVYVMPFFHMGASPQVFMSTLKQGKQGYIMRKFELEKYLRWNCQYGCNETFMVPPMLNAVVQSGLCDEKSKNYKPECSLRTIRLGVTGAAPLSADLQKRYAQLLAPDAINSQGWGMTETTCVGVAIPQSIDRAIAAGKLDTAIGSVGLPVSNLHTKLIDGNGSDVTEGCRGELCVRGPTVFKGYFENEKATGEAFDSEGYFKTGDVCEARKHLDPETGEALSLLYVVDRSKELIKVKAFQVAPPELEGVLISHPDIVDAAVIGVPHGNDEAPKAFLVTRPGSQIDAETVNKYMAERLAPYKQLVGGIEFVSVIPKMASGKILKRVLREQEKVKRRRQQSMM